MNAKPHRATALALALCLAGLAPLAACDQPRVPEPRAQPAPAAPAQSPDLKDRSSPDPAIAPALDPAIAALDEAEAREQLRALRPATTRAQTLRFTDPLLARPEAAEIFAARLARPGVPAEERAALAEALPRCGGAWTEALVDAAAIEADPAVRATLISGLRRAAPPLAIPALTLALDDRDPEVRRAAAEVAGWVPAVGDGLRPQLRALLSDRSRPVATEATRALGLLGDAPAFPAIADQLRVDDLELRVEALHALERIDAARALEHPAVRAALIDHDPRVRAAAERLRAAASPAR
ncbi:MAG: HEAT repeat domain-containing protein [Nannocystis sp.]|nr:HEAT repeat domain-containing protein [Nannocystis sp.]